MRAIGTRTQIQAIDRENSAKKVFRQGCQLLYLNNIILESITSKDCRESGTSRTFTWRTWSFETNRAKPNDYTARNEWVNPIRRSDFCDSSGDSEFPTELPTKKLLFSSKPYFINKIFIKKFTIIWRSDVLNIILRWRLKKGQC